MDIITIAGYTTASIAVVGAAYKYLIRPAYRGIKSVINLVTRLDNALPTIFAIAEQFRPNGGGSLRDVIDRIEVQQALSKSRTKVLLSMIDVGVFEADYKGLCTWVNRQWCNMAGLSPEEATNNGWVTAIHPEDREKVYEEWADSIRDGRDFDLTYRFQNLATGVVTLVRGHATAIKNSKIEHTIYLGTITPITS